MYKLIAGSHSQREQTTDTITGSNLKQSLTGSRAQAPAPGSCATIFSTGRCLPLCRILLHVQRR